MIFTKPRYRVITGRVSYARGLFHPCLSLAANQEVCFPNDRVSPLSVVMWEETFSRRLPSDPPNAIGWPLDDAPADFSLN